MSGNAPVILVVSKPRENEAYWVSIKDYFATPVRRKAKRVEFNKRTMRFSEESLPALFELAVARDAGLYIAPRPREERLYSNFLFVSGFPKQLWIGDTTVKRPAEVYARLRDAGIEASEFVISGKRLVAPYDLTERPWSDFVDRGTVEEIDSSHWASSDDPDLVNLFVDLLNRCLTVRCGQIGCERRRDDEMYCFTATPDLAPRVVPYRSVGRASRRTVFCAYYFTKGERKGELNYYRHSAFVGQFRRYDGVWYLIITPTYRFTIDGRVRHRFYESKLKGIKALEKNGTVLGHVVMWASLLRGRDEGVDDFFFTPPYPHLRFGALATFDLTVGIDDQFWLPNEDRVLAKSVSSTENDLPLFEEVSPYADEDEEVDEE